MSSMIEQYEIEWINFLDDDGTNTNVTDNDISPRYKKFRPFIKKKAKHYIKQNFTPLERLQLSRTYSNLFGNTERDKLDIKVQTLVNQFFTWKKEKDLLDANENKLSSIFSDIFIKTEQEIGKNKNSPIYCQKFKALQESLFNLKLDFRDLEKTQSIINQLNIKSKELKYLQDIQKKEKEALSRIQARIDAL